MNLYKNRYFPLGAQVVSLLIFAFLLSGGFGIESDSPRFLKQLRNTNLSNLIVWSYWWPLIVITAVIFGRHWCTICPVELVSTLFERVGLKLKSPKWMKSEWLIPILYCFIAVVAIHTWGIHRSPHKMALYLSSLLLLAIIVSLLFEKRAFCSYLCPVGKLLGLYSLLAKVGIRVKSNDVCKSCKSKDCISKANSSKIIGRSCTSNLYPDNISDNRECILCTQCVKSCTKDNIALKPVKKQYAHFNADKLKSPEIAMTIILIGFICYEILSSWKFSKSFLMWLPKNLYEFFGTTIISEKLFEALVIFMIAPSALILSIASISYLINKSSFVFYLKRTVLFILPLVAFGHLFKGLLKTTSRIPYWKLALEDSEGIKYANQIVNKQLKIENIEWLNIMIIFIGITGLLIALLLSVKKINSDSSLKMSNKILFHAIVVIHFVILTFGPIYKLMSLW